MIVTGKDIWIIDYKLGRDRMEQDRKQIEDYKNLVGEIYKDKTVKGFLVYVGETIEIVDV